VENQPKKTVKNTPAVAGSSPCAVSQGSLKKAKVNDSKPGTVSYWTDSLNRYISSFISLYEAELLQLHNLNNEILFITCASYHYNFLRFQIYFDKEKNVSECFSKRS
jgi:hypothetical protein